jgi:hypothetical protein
MLHLQPSAMVKVQLGSPERDGKWHALKEPVRKNNGERRHERNG